MVARLRQLATLQGGYSVDRPLPQWRDTSVGRLQDALFNAPRRAGESFGGALPLHRFCHVPV